MVWRAVWLWALAVHFIGVNTEITCLPERFGVNINYDDCLEARRVIFANMVPQQRITRRTFSLYNQDPHYRVPQGNSVRSCAVGFDIRDGNQDTISISWEQIRLHLEKLIAECPGRRHIGGYMYMDGLVLLVTNPTQVSGYGTCMASPAARGRPIPRRLNLAECMVTHGLGQPPAAPQAAVQGVEAASGPRLVSPAASQNSQNHAYRPAPVLPPTPPSLGALNPAYYFPDGDTERAAVSGGNLPNPFGAARNWPGAAQFRPLPIHPLAMPGQAGPSRPVAAVGIGLPGALYLPPGGGQGAPREGSPVGSQGSIYGGNSPAGQRGGIGAVQGALRAYQGVGLGGIHGGVQGGAQGGAQGGVQGGVQDHPQEPQRQPQGPQGQAQEVAQGGAARGAARGGSPDSSGGSSMETITQSMPDFSSMFNAPPLTSERIMDMWLWRRPGWFHTNRGGGREERTWESQGAFMAIKLKGPSAPFPSLIPQVSQPARKTFVKMPWKPAREQMIWAWKASDLQWEPYDGPVPTQEDDVVQGSWLGGWILVKFASPSGGTLAMPTGKRNLLQQGT